MTKCRKKGRKRGRVRIAGKRAKEKRETKGEWSEGERALVASVVHVARALYMNVTQDVAVGLSCILCTTPPDYTEYHARLRPIILNTMHDYARLSRIPCTPTTDYPEYHAPLRLILLYPVYDSDRFARFFMKIANKFAYSKNSSYLCSRICVRALLRARIFSNVLL